MYVQSEDGWLFLRCKHCPAVPDSFYEIGEIVPVEGEWTEDNEEGVSCPIGDECEYFFALRYRITDMRNRTFVVYSNEGRPGDPVQAEENRLSISLSESDLLHFTIHNDFDESMWHCWTRTDKRQDVAWGEDSRLERKMEDGTWELFSHNLDLCEQGVDQGIEIPPGQSIEMDGTTAYPDYSQLLSGVYRWVINLNYQNTHDLLVFSPCFEWDGVEVRVSD